MQRAIVAIVSGRVQLVMYRDFAQRKARHLGITGQVQNLPNGTVRVYAEGEEESLEKFIELLKKGSLLSAVQDVSYQYVAPKGGFTKFSIQYS